MAHNCFIKCNIFNLTFCIQPFFCLISINLIILVKNNTNTNTIANASNNNKNNVLYTKLANAEFESPLHPAQL